jgi:type IV pilus assembly protein PilB
MMSLTLLDGTTIGLPPAAPAAKKSGLREGLTTRELVSALRAKAQGADAAEALGEAPQWESIVAALLSLMLRKGVIADRELIEELRKL